MCLLLRGRALRAAFAGSVNGVGIHRGHFSAVCTLFSRVRNWECLSPCEKTQCKTAQRVLQANRIQANAARTDGRTDGSFGVGGRRRTDAATFSASRCAPGRGATKRTSVAGVGPVRRRRHVRAALVNREGISRRCINWAGFAQRGRACKLPRVRIREGVHGWALLREFDFASSARSLYELFGSIW